MRADIFLFIIFIIKVSSSQFMSHLYKITERTTAKIYTFPFPFEMTLRCCDALFSQL